MNGNISIDFLEAISDFTCCLYGPDFSPNNNNAISSLEEDWPICDLRFKSKLYINQDGIYNHLKY